MTSTAASQRNESCFMQKPIILRLVSLRFVGWSCLGLGFCISAGTNSKRESGTRLSNNVSACKADGPRAFAESAKHARMCFRRVRIYQDVCSPGQTAGRSPAQQCNTKEIHHSPAREMLEQYCGNFTDAYGSKNQEVSEIERD